MLKDINHYELSGHNNQLKVQAFGIVEIPDFIHFLRNGWGFGLTVAIDFTASNREVTDKASLHYQNAFNQY